MKLRNRSEDDATTAAAVPPPPKPAKMKRGSRSAVVELVPVTSFSFVSEYWEGRDKIRKRNIAVASVVAAAVIVVAMLSFRALQTASGLEEDLASLQAQSASVQNDITTLTGGIASLPDHLKTRRDEVIAALSHDMNVTAIVTTVRATLPPTVDIVSISVVEVAQAAQTTTTSEETDGENVEGDAVTEVVTESAAATGKSVYELNMSLQTNLREDVRNVREAMATIPGIGSATPTQTGEPSEGLQITFTATIDADILQSRRFQATQELDANSDSVVVTDTTTPSGTATPTDTTPQEEGS